MFPNSPLKTRAEDTSISTLAADENGATRFAWSMVFVGCLEAACTFFVERKLFITRWWFQVSVILYVVFTPTLGDDPI